MNNNTNENVTQLNNIIRELTTMPQYFEQENNINVLLFQIRGHFDEYTGEQLAPKIINLYNNIPAEPNMNYIHQLWTAIQTTNEENWEEPDSQGSGRQYIGPDDFFEENYGIGLKHKGKRSRRGKKYGRKTRRGKKYGKKSRRGKKYGRKSRR